MKERLQSIRTEECLYLRESELEIQSYVFACDRLFAFERGVQTDLNDIILPSRGLTIASTISFYHPR